MKRSLFGIVVALLLFAAPAAAQVHFGLTGGWATPYGTTKDYAKSGWDAGLTLQIGAPLVPVWFRIDGTYADMAGVTQPLVVVGTGTSQFTIYGASGNVAWAFIGSTLPTKVYIIGGIGYYNVMQKIAVTNPTGPPVTLTSTNFGYNAGLGVKFSKFFFEARWTNIDGGLDLTAYGKGKTSLEMVPINFGIVF